MLLVSAALAILMGILALAAGSWGIHYTRSLVTREHITTPKDASIPNKPVIGPHTLKAQADIIREHTLKMTGGKTYAEMPQTIVKLDAQGNPVLGKDGKSVMVPNAARDIWVTATALTAALNLGIATYALSGFALLFGLVSIWTGATFFVLSRKL